MKNIYRKKIRKVCVGLFSRVYYGVLCTVVVCSSDSLQCTRRVSLLSLVFLRWKYLEIEFSDETSIGAYYQQVHQIHSPLRIPRSKGQKKRSKHKTPKYSSSINSNSKPLSPACTNLPSNTFIVTNHAHSEITSLESRAAGEG